MDLCFTPQGCMTQAVDSVWTGFAETIRTAAGQMVTTLFAWWTATPSMSVDAAVTHTAQRFVTSWLALPIAVVALVAVVGWGVASGSDTWVRDVVRGLFVFGVVAAGAVPIVSAVQAWSESLAQGLLGAIPFGDIGSRFEAILETPGMTPGMVSFWAALIFLAGAVQYVLMLFRDGVVLLLTVLLPVAAAGQFSRSSVLWLPKLAGWLAAFVFLKPAAALVYFVGLSLFGQVEGVQGMATAACLLVAALFALPALLRLVTFAVDSAPLHTNALSLGATVSGVAASGAQLITRSGGGGADAAAGASGPTGATGAAGTTAASPVVAAGAAAVGAASNIPRTTSQAIDPMPSTTSCPGGTTGDTK